MFQELVVGRQAVGGWSGAAIAAGEVRCHTQKLATLKPGEKFLVSSYDVSVQLLWFVQMRDT